MFSEEGEMQIVLEINGKVAPSAETCIAITLHSLPERLSDSCLFVSEVFSQTVVHSWSLSERPSRIFENRLPDTVYLPTHSSRSACSVCGGPVEVTPGNFHGYYLYFLPNATFEDTINRESSVDAYCEILIEQNIPGQLSWNVISGLWRMHFSDTLGRGSSTDAYIETLIEQNIPSEATNIHCQERISARSIEGRALRRRLLKGRVLVFITAGYSGKRFIYERIKELGVRAVMIDGPESWSRILEGEGVLEKFVPFDWSDQDTVFERCLEACKRVEQVKLKPE
jgi:hypothetical protein